MTLEEQLDHVAKAWRAKPETEDAAAFDRRIGDELGIRPSTVYRRRKARGLQTPRRAPRPRDIRRKS